MDHKQNIKVHRFVHVIRLVVKFHGRFVDLNKTGAGTNLVHLRGKGVFHLTALGENFVLVKI